ncbi:rhodanese-like domain-containing protein [Candidatus Altiarchaeota archaeon]
MKRVVHLLAALLLTSITLSVSAQEETINVTVVANSIDSFMARDYLKTLRFEGINPIIVNASEYPYHERDSLIFILGGHNAPEGIGDITYDLMTQAERDQVVSEPDARHVTVLPNLNKKEQTIIIFAGYEKEQTNKLLYETRREVINMLKFKEGDVKEEPKTAKTSIPSLDPTVPFTEVSADEGKAIIDGISDLTIIDVRAGPYYNAGHIPGAVNIPERVLFDKVSSLDKDMTYILYCGGNSQSINVGNIMNDAGFTKLYRIVDGYVAWRKAGYSRARGEA